MLECPKALRVAISALPLLLMVGAEATFAQNVRLTENVEEVRVTVNGDEVVIARNQDESAMIGGDFAKTSRACPPFCIQPAAPVTGVSSVAELEVLDFIKEKVSAGSGVVLDARLPEWFSKGSIPGAVNVPFATLSPDNPYRNDILMALGAKPLGGNDFDFSEALDLMVFCNGAWSDQSVRALKSLRAAGYPTEKMFYYRGGMQDWQMLGLTVAGQTTVAQAGGQP